MENSKKNFGNTKVCVAYTKKTSVNNFVIG